MNEVPSRRIPGEDPTERLDVGNRFQFEFTRIERMEGPRAFVDPVAGASPLPALHEGRKLLLAKLKIAPVKVKTLDVEMANLIDYIAPLKNAICRPIRREVV